MLIDNLDRLRITAADAERISVPGGAHVYLPLAPAVAAAIYRRLSHLPVSFHLPPDLGAGSDISGHRK